MPSVAFVINRTRVRNLGRLHRACREAAAAAGLRPQFLETTVDERGVGLALGAVEAGSALVFAVGGDGTVRACAEALAGTEVPLAIVPRGTANLAARALGIPAGLDAALAIGFGGRDHRIDLARADGITFAAMAGIGLDAAVVGATPGLLKERLGWAGYAMSGVTRLAGRRHVFRVRLDGGRLLARPARCVVVGNAGLLPGGFVLLPAARLDDGLLDVGILAARDPVGWGRVTARILTRSERSDRVLERCRARRIEISTEVMLPREVDGEIISPGRSLTVTLRPGALLVRTARQPLPRYRQ
jgi:diacylglycerol kinase family enzyme